jgi:hypothetical protein
MRIRHYGFLSNRNRRQKLEVIRQCLQAPPCEQIKKETDAGVKLMACPCPKCKKGQLQVRYEIPATPLFGR